MFCVQCTLQREAGTQGNGTCGLALVKEDKMQLERHASLYACQTAAVGHTGAGGVFGHW